MGGVLLIRMAAVVQQSSLWSVVMDGGEAARQKFLLVAAAFQQAGPFATTLQQLAALPCASNSGEDQMAAFKQHVVSKGFCLWKLLQMLTDAAAVNNTFGRAVNTARQLQVQQVQTAGAAHPAMVLPTSTLPRSIAERYYLVNMEGAKGGHMCVAVWPGGGGGQREDIYLQKDWSKKIGATGGIVLVA